DRKAARDVLEERELKVRIEEIESDLPRHQVVRTDPAAYQKVAKGSTVTLFVSDGPEQLPDVVGMMQDAAVKALEEAGFVPDIIPWSDTTEPAGTVVRQTPQGGEDAPNNTTVAIFVSTYEEPEETPEPTPTDTPTPTPPVPTDPVPGPPTPPGARPDER